MRKLTLVCLFIITITTIFAQKPAWTDYNNRLDLYPDTEFITGYISGVNTQDKEPGQLKSVYETLAKEKLVESIQVEIETNTSLVVSNKNGSSDEEFLSKSVSFSNANVAGLTVQSFYDRRKKEVFAFAFVSKKELAFYYRNKIKSGQEDIEQKLKQGIDFSKKGKKEQALKSYYETMPIFMEIDQARTLLIAINRSMYADINVDEINNLRLDVNSEIVKLVNPSELTLSETSYFMAYGLFLQLGDIQKKMNIAEFTYENTGLVSDFGAKLTKEFTGAIIDAGGYEVANSKSNNNVIVQGNYWKENDFIKISVSAYIDNNLIAVSTGSLPTTWIEAENLDYLPVQIPLLNSLEGYEIKVIDVPNSLKVGIPSTNPIIIKLVVSSNGEEIPIEGVPLEITDNELNEKLCGSVTNKEGICTFFLPAIVTDKPVYGMTVSISLDEYLFIDSNSLYYTIASMQNPVDGLEVNITTEKPTITVVSKELIQGKSMDIKTLEPAVKEILADNGYNFVDEESKADYILNIEANTTTGSTYEGIYFAFLDVNLSVTNNILDEEIYKIHLDQIKGGGSNYAKASKKAYTIAATKLKESIINSVLMK